VEYHLTSWKGTPKTSEKTESTKGKSLYSLFGSDYLFFEASTPPNTA
jgi:hypothetical protein